MEAREHMQLLAVMAQGLGAKLRNYEDPAERLAGHLDELAHGPGGSTEDRRAAVLAAVLGGGGEVA
jgi:hypothetical protein